MLLKGKRNDLGWVFEWLFNVHKPNNNLKRNYAFSAKFSIYIYVPFNQLLFIPEQ